MTRSSGLHDSSPADDPIGGWAELRRSAVPWRPPAIPTTAVVPHPDDEVLMFGGLIDLQRRRGLPVHIIAVTDGEAAYQREGAPELGAVRRAEHAAALDELGVVGDDVVRLGLPDGGVADNEHIVADAIGDLGDALVVAPWHHDHHTDHEACGRAAATACASSGAARYSGIFWAWWHTDAQRLGDERMVSLHVDARAADRRQAALEHHRSQLDHPAATLDDRALAPLSWRAEYYIGATTPVPRPASSVTESSLIRPGRGLER